MSIPRIVLTFEYTLKCGYLSTFRSMLTAESDVYISQTDYIQKTNYLQNSSFIYLYKIRQKHNDIRDIYHWIIVHTFKISTQRTFVRGNLKFRNLLRKSLQNQYTYIYPVSHCIWMWKCFFRRTVKILSDLTTFCKKIGIHDD